MIRGLPAFDWRDVLSDDGGNELQSAAAGADLDRLEGLLGVVFPPS
jgi:hypothetical protein